jgi:hypothetical protein
MANLTRTQSKNLAAYVQRKQDKMIERAFYLSCTGLAISILDIDKVFKHGRRLIEENNWNEFNTGELAADLRAYVETLAK